MQSDDVTVKTIYSRSVRTGFSDNEYSVRNIANAQSENIQSQNLQIKYESNNNNKTVKKNSSNKINRLDFRRLPGPVFDFPEQRLVIEPTK